MNSRVSFALALCAALALACKTAPILEGPPIEVPGGLTAAEIQIAILTAVTNRPLPPQYELKQVTAGPAAETFAWSLFGDTQRHVSGWYVEDHHPGEITTGFDSRGHYLKVAVHYDLKVISTAIVDSQNFQQYNGRIHKKANARLSQLQGRIRYALSQVAATRAGNSPPLR